MRSARRARLSAGGFTLIEAVTVVLIIGILATVAVVGYRRFLSSARMSEATNLIGDIRRSQEEHKAESGTYANISSSPTSYYPAATPGAFYSEWGGPCSNCSFGASSWELLHIRPSGPVIFGYSTTAGVGGSVSSSIPAGRARSAAAPAPIGATDPFYVATAMGDTDGNGVACYVVGMSHSNQLIITDEGE